jgi:hypothetical protein
MSTLDKAIQIAAQAHDGQKDKDGKPYILHPLRVMLGVEGELAQMVAALHDVVEDTSTTADDIRRAGFSEEVLEALRCVTHEDGVSYTDYVVRCKGNPIARQVKLSDLRDNSQLSRTLFRPDRIERDTARLQRYALAYKYLTDRISESEYRSLMEKVK